MADQVKSRKSHEGAAQDSCVLTDKAAAKKRKPAITLYVGISLIIAWFHCIWFVPNAYLNVELLAWQVTVAWLVMLASSTLALFVTPLLLRSERHLSDVKPLLYVTPAVLSLGGLALCLGISTTENPVMTIALPIALGIFNALLWIQWGEWYATIKASYHIGQVALTVSAVVLFSLAATIVLPTLAGDAFVALLPIMSSWCLIRIRTSATCLDYPKPLPQNERSKGFRNALVVGGICISACAACYFVVAIIPVPDLAFGDSTFTVGALVGGTVLGVIGAFGKLSRKFDIYRLFPWMLAFATIAVILYAANDVALYLPAFLTALTISLICEILLLMYIGVLSSNGYISPATAFGFSGGFARAGILVGNGIAVVFEHNAALEKLLLTPVTMAFMIILVVLIIPLVRREYAIAALTAPIDSLAELDLQIEAVAKEFGLSSREKDVLSYVVRGYTAEAIGKQLFISSYTAQTHIQHIYAKTQIHKRSDLIDYVTKRKVPAGETAPTDRAAIDTLPDYWPFPS
ncbi:helix-turn-helix transcriptional regulator [Slackia exigua]|uniref:helix-turn-helix transcriptional regulator n=1 Tax=Slackia exigua TaxID=84109 RepID=UPI0028DCAD00|nr:helix-turn-helix transcriptional regulator [Slackia exigua]